MLLITITDTKCPPHKAPLPRPPLLQGNNMGCKMPIMAFLGTC